MSIPFSIISMRILCHSGGKRESKTMFDR